jgi:hypothetical protein
VTSPQSQLLICSTDDGACLVNHSIKSELSELVLLKPQNRVLGTTGTSTVRYVQRGRTAAVLVALFYLDLRSAAPCII